MPKPSGFPGKLEVSLALRVGHTIRVQVGTQIVQSDKTFNLQHRQAQTRNLHLMSLVPARFTSERVVDPRLMGCQIPRMFQKHPFAGVFTLSLCRHVQGTTNAPSVRFYYLPLAAGTTTTPPLPLRQRPPPPRQRY